METIIICVFALSAVFGADELPSECAQNYQDPSNYTIYHAMDDAGVPEHLWEDFAAVAACESNYRNDAEGDGGLAKGLYQIHWHFWLTWAHGQDLLLEIGYNDWTDPVANTALAYAIGEYYDRANGRDRWAQWSVKPHWPGCRSRVEPPPTIVKEVILVSPNGDFSF